MRLISALDNLLCKVNIAITVHTGELQIWSAEFDNEGKYECQATKDPGEPYPQSEYTMSIQG